MFDQYNHNSNVLLQLQWNFKMFYVTYVIYT